MSFRDEGKESLEWLMNEGHFDAIRKKVNESLRHNEELRHFTVKLLEDSQTIANADLQQLQQPNKKKIMDDLRKELEDKVLDRASKVAWTIMTDSDDSICRLIEEKVHESLCAIHEKRSAAASAQTTG